MITTRDAVMAALLARLETAADALPRGSFRRNATEPADLRRGGVDFALYDGSPGPPEPEIDPEPPYYVSDEAQIAITVSQIDRERDATVTAALVALDAALSADERLGGLIKGRMLWALADRDDAALDGLSPDAVAIVTVAVEYETATRLGV